MTVRLDGDLIRLEGVCRVEEAETLLVLAREDGARQADLSGCDRLHAAVAQVLISFSIPVVGLPPDAFVRDFVGPNLKLKIDLGKGGPG